MRVVEEIVRNESVEDVLTVFALNMGIPRLDMMYGHYRKEVVLSGELFSVFQRLVNEGFLLVVEVGTRRKAPTGRRLLS